MGCTLLLGQFCCGCFHLAITSGLNIPFWCHTLKDWLTILHWHSTIHHKAEMRYRRGTEGNFSTDSSLNGPQCNAASWYAAVRVRVVGFFSLWLYMITAAHTKLNATSWAQWRLSKDIWEKAGNHKLKLKPMWRVDGSLVPKNNLCHLDTKSLLACTEPHRLMRDNSVSVSKGGFFH